MRLVASVVACVGIALTVAGCDPSTDKAYFRQGVGTELYRPDVATSSELQDLYVAHICHQAGLAYEAGSCGADGFSPTTWGLFVQAGMNDIDQRCDAYLTWLDNVRRAEAPILKQISDTHTATEVIMQATGVGAAPIAVVGAAFGLAASTFTNINSRLVLEVNHSTVQAVVLTRQAQYREQLLGNPAKNIPPVVIASKPAAIYALRSYLRLCMPITIETEINNTVTVFERGGAIALANKEPMISAKSVGTLVIRQPARDVTYTSLRAQLFPNGATKADPVLVAYVQSLFGPPPIAIGVILAQPSMASLRQKISACIVARRAGQPCAPGSLAQFR